MKRGAKPKLNGRRPSGRIAAPRAKQTDDTRLGAERVIMAKRDRFNPVRGLTPDKLVRHIENFRAGYLRDFSLVADVMEEQDDTLQSVAPKTKQAIARHGFEILTVDFDENNAQLKKLAEQQVTALTFFYNQLTATHALDQDERGGFQLLVRQMMDAHGKKYAVHEIVWVRKRDLEGKEFYTATFWFVPLQFFEATTGRLRFIETPLGMEGVPMAEGEWLVTVGRGVMIACAIAYMFKHLPLKDWLGFCEKFGFPGVHGKTNARKGSIEWNDMKRAVANFMVDWGVVTTLDEAIELIEVKSGNTLPFDDLVDRMDRAITRLWRGADLGTMSREKETTGVTAQTDETEVIEQDLAAWITETLNIKIDRKVIEYTFGPDAPVLAYVKVLTNERVNVDQEIKINDHLVNNGARISLKNEMERFGRTEAAPDEDILVAPQQQASSDPEDVARGAANEVRAGLIRYKRAELLKTAAQQLGEARLADFMPFLNHVAQIASMSNPAAMLQAARNVRKKLPQYLKALNAKPAEAEVLAQTLTAEFFNGIDNAAKERGRKSETGDRKKKKAATK